MAFLKHLRRLQFIDYLIKRKATGDLQNLANKNYLSKSHMGLVLKEMKELGFPIKYNRKQKSYYYKEQTKVSLPLLESLEGIEILTREEASRVTTVSKYGVSNLDNLCFSEEYTFQPCVK